MTTITIDPDVKQLLDGLKLHEKEPYNSVVKRIATNAYDLEPLSKEDLEDIEEAVQDIKEGKYYSEEEAYRLMDANEETCTP